MTERGQNFNPENETSISMLLKILGGVAATGVAAVTTYAVSKKVSEHIANARPAQETTEGDNL